MDETFMPRFINHRRARSPFQLATLLASIRKHARSFYFAVQVPGALAVTLVSSYA